MLIDYAKEDRDILHPLLISKVAQILVLNVNVNVSKVNVNVNVSNVSKVSRNVSKGGQKICLSFFHVLSHHSLHVVIKRTLSK